MVGANEVKAMLGTIVQRLREVTVRATVGPASASAGTS